jgi:phage replication O-like protein O
MELMASTSLGEREAKVIPAIARKTLGYRGKTEGDRISASQLAKLTGIGRSHVAETLGRLDARRIIKRRDGINGRAAIVALNLDGGWLDEPVPVQGQVNLSRGEDRSAAEPVPGPGQKPVPLSGHTRGKGVKQPQPESETLPLQRLAFDAWTGAGGHRLLDRERGALARNVAQLERKDVDPHLILAAVKDLARKGDFPGLLQQRVADLKAAGGPCTWHNDRRGLTHSQLLECGCPACTQWAEATLTAGAAT